MNIWYYKDMFEEMFIFDLVYSGRLFYIEYRGKIFDIVGEYFILCIVVEYLIWQIVGVTNGKFQLQLSFAKLYSKAKKLNFPTLDASHFKCISLQANTDQVDEKKNYWSTATTGDIHYYTLHYLSIQYNSTPMIYKSVEWTYISGIGAQFA